MTGASATAGSAAAAWAASGAMALSGPAGGPACGPPAPLVPAVRATGARITAAAGSRGATLALDWLALLGERAALDGLRRRGTTSCGGGSRLLHAADGWVAVSLARPDDVEALPAWLGTTVGGAVAGEEVWDGVAAAVSARTVDDLVDGAELLGLPVGACRERAPDGEGGVGRTAVGGAPRLDRPARVLDLGALWAGPLCGHLLHAAGADVVKVESTTRPDASRAGSPRLFDLLNGGKPSVALDLARAAGRAALLHLVRRADVVVESARPRALEQLGIRARDELRRPGGPRVWVSITGHGRSSRRVAFGDDAAVSGGLVVGEPARPMFCADAVADPLSGLAAAAAALEALATGGTWLLDVAMAGVAAAHAGPELPAAGLDPAPPRARAAAQPARALGADTEAVLARW